MKAIAASLTFAWLAAGCVDTGTQLREIELRVRGRDGSEFVGRDGWSVELSRARVAFGPVTFCPGRSAGEFCDTARAEWLDSVVVNGLDSRSERAGDVLGASGAVSSWMYDYGLVSMLTQSKPYVTAAARKLDGQSVDVAGCAVKEERRVCFDLQARIAQNTVTEQGVPVVRVNGSDEVRDFAVVDRIEFTFEPASWLAQVDFDEIATTACDGECEPLALGPDSQAVRAVQTALVAAARPSVRFFGEP